MTEEHKQLQELYRNKGELTTQIEIAQYKLKQVNDLIAKLLTSKELNDPVLPIKSENV